MNHRPFLALFAGCWLGELTACKNVWMVFAALLFPGILVLFFKNRTWFMRGAVLSALIGFFWEALCFPTRTKGSGDRKRHWKA